MCENMFLHVCGNMCVGASAHVYDCMCRPRFEVGDPRPLTVPLSIHRGRDSDTALAHTAGLDSLLVWGFPDSAAVTCGSLFPHEFWRSELLDLIPD